MLGEDLVLDRINDLIGDIDEAEMKNFNSERDKAYRLEAVRTMFIGMGREQQDIILQTMFYSLGQHENNLKLR